MASHSKNKMAVLKFTSFLLVFAVLLGWFWHLDFEIEPIIGELKETPPWVFILAMIFLPMFAFPMSPFYVFAGAAYGWGAATAYCCVALLFNQLLSYYVAHSLMREFFEHQFQKRNWKVPEIPERIRLQVTFWVRLIPASPYFLQNYALALANVPMRVYLGISWPVQTLIASLVVLVGVAWTDETLSNIWLPAAAILSLLVVKGVVILHAKRTMETTRAMREYMHDKRTLMPDWMPFSRSATEKVEPPETAESPSRS